MKNIKQPGVVADSVLAAEMAAYQHGAKDIVWCRHLAEEFANLVPVGCTDMVMRNSAPPTSTFIDNLSIQSLVSGETGKGKALRAWNRVISHLRSLKQEYLTDPIGVPTIEQQADIGTKQYKNATAYWREAVGPLGDHPALRAMQERVQVVNGRGPRKRDFRGVAGSVLEEEEEEVEVEEDVDGTAILNVAMASDRVTEEMDLCFALEQLGRLTMENTRLNADRDSEHRRMIWDFVASGHGDKIGRLFGVTRKEKNAIRQYLRHTDKLSFKKKNVVFNILTVDGVIYSC